MFRCGLWIVLLASFGVSREVCAQARPTLADRPMPGLRQGQIHNPFSPRYAPLVPNSYASRRQVTDHDSHHVGHSRGIVLSPHAWLSVQDDYCYPLPAPQPPVLFGFSPLVIPTDALYGPAAAARVLGNIPFSQPATNHTWIAPSHSDPVWNQPPPDDPLPPVRSNAERVARAKRMIDHGDEHFRQQRYGEAYRRYKLAAQAAPDLAEAYFRQALALVALTQYDAACEAIRRGFEFDVEWAKSPFRLDEIYADNHLAKQAHLDALAEAAEAAPQDARLWYLVGVVLYFDDRPERAEPFFERAQQLAGHNVYLHGFLRELDEAQAVPPPEPEADAEEL